MHINIQMKAGNIYMAPIYMYARLLLGIYGPYIYTYIYIYVYIYRLIKRLVHKAEPIYIYIYTHLNLGVQG